MTSGFHYHSKDEAKKTLEHYNKYAQKILEMIRDA
jgi:hypothetical protein